MAKVLYFCKSIKSRSTFNYPYILFNDYLRPDGIPNKVLKVVALVIVKDLAEAASYCFANGTIPESLKESITMVLRKEGKKDYSLPGSYRPITLKNTLAKVLEKHEANIILEAVEEYRLLP